MSPALVVTLQTHLQPEFTFYFCAKEEAASLYVSVGPHFPSHLYLWEQFLTDPGRSQLSSGFRNVCVLVEQSSYLLPVRGVRS